MEYYVIMEEVDDLEREAEHKTAEWSVRLTQTQQAVGGLLACLEENGAGKTAEAAGSYMRDVHGCLLGQLAQLSAEMASRCLQYAEGYFEIEADNCAGEIAQESLEEQMQALEEGEAAFLEAAGELERVLAGVSDILPVSAPSTAAVETGFRALHMEAQRLWEEVGNYEADHIATDFAVMEETMDRLESLIDRVSGKGEVRIAQYHAGEILEYEETKGLERLAQKREEYFIRNGKSIEEQMEEYWQRILLEEREIRGELRVYAGLTSMMVTAGMAGCILGAGFAAAPVAAKVFEGAVKGLAFTSIVYNTSEIYEGIGDIVLAGKGDIVSVAANPVRDLLPEEMQWVYYCIGEGSGLILQAWGMTSGFMMLSQVYGVKTAAVEFVKIETSGLLAGQMGEAAEKNGASAADVYRLEMAAAFVSYGTLSGMRPAVRAFKNESDLWMNRLTVPEIPVVYQSYWEGRRIAGQRKEELLGIEKIDEYRGQGGREQGAGTANEGGLDTIIKNGKISIDDIKTNPSAFSGKSAEEIADVLRNSGYDVTIKNSTRSRSGAQIIQINNPGGGKNISQVQVSSGGGRHGSNPYVKISTTDQGIIKIVDGIESTYKTDGKETATIIFSGGN